MEATAGLSPEILEGHVLVSKGPNGFHDQRIRHICFTFAVQMGTRIRGGLRVPKV